MSSRPRRLVRPTFSLFSARTRPGAFALVLAGLAGGTAANANGAEAPEVTVASPVFVTQLGGGSSEKATAVAMDDQGCLYVTGWTRSGDFPTTAEVFDEHVDDRDAFVAKLGPDGQDLIWSTVLGGTREEEATTLLVDGSGVVLVGGWTTSDDFPTTDLAHRRERVGWKDGFVTMLDPNAGRVLSSTYVGGSGNDGVTGLTLAPDGDLVLTGWTESRDLPTLEHALQPKLGGGVDVFVLRLDAIGSQMRYATYLGGRGDDHAVGLAIDGSGYMTLAGTTQSRDFPVTSGAHDQQKNGGDVFVTKLTPEGHRLVFSTYYGGSADEVAHGLALAPDGGAVVVGTTRSDDLPVDSWSQSSRAGRRDGFVLHLSGSGGALIFSRYLGGSADDALAGVALDVLGGVWVGGRTQSDDLDVTAAATQPERGGAGDVLLARLDAQTGIVQYMTYVGGAGDEELWALAADRFHGGVSFAGLAQRTEPGLRGEHSGYGAASDALVGRFVPGTCGVPAFVVPHHGVDAVGLDSTFPHLGLDLELTVSGAVPGARGLLFLGAPAASPLELEGLGTVFLNPSTASMVSSFVVDENGQARFTLPLPEASDLCGLRVVVQGLVDGRATDAVELILGG